MYIPRCIEKHSMVNDYYGKISKEGSRGKDLENRLESQESSSNSEKNERKEAHARMNVDKHVHSMLHSLH